MAWRPAAALGRPSAQPAAGCQVISSIRARRRSRQPQPRPTWAPAPCRRPEDSARHRDGTARGGDQLRSQQYANARSASSCPPAPRVRLGASTCGWVDQVEQVGNLNYPTKRAGGRIGRLVVISVGVRRDGSVESTRIIQSSIPMLDNAAMSDCTAVAPFEDRRRAGSPMSLHVTRTWQFLPGGELLDRLATAHEGLMQSTSACSTQIQRGQRRFPSGSGASPGAGTPRRRSIPGALRIPRVANTTWNAPSPASSAGSCQAVPRRVAELGVG